VIGSIVADRFAVRKPAWVACAVLRFRTDTITGEQFPGESKRVYGPLQRGIRRLLLSRSLGDLSAWRWVHDPVKGLTLDAQSAYPLVA